MIESFIVIQMIVSFSKTFWAYTFAIGFRTDLKLDQKLLLLHNHIFLHFLKLFVRFGAMYLLTVFKILICRQHNLSPFHFSSHFLSVLEKIHNLRL